jgi:hypothetical protein
MKTKVIILCILWTGMAVSSPAQYRSPLDLPLSMSANFAELRSNHFHSGIDYRTGGRAGAKIYAVADGFVSRIYVSPSGYGKAIYIEHPTGETSLYGHLDCFAGRIAEYVKSYQYAHQKFIVNDYLDSTKIRVRKGEIIGYSGNSGSSRGAHLHFELRESKRQAPVNPITRKYFKVGDKLAPTAHRLAVFTLDSLNEASKPRLLKSEKTVKINGDFAPEKTKTFDVCNPVFFGVAANDYQPENTSKQGVNVYKAYLDDKLFFACTLNEFEFKDTRCINSFIAYDELKKSEITYAKTYIEPGNTLPIYKGTRGNGLIYLADTLPHAIRIEMYDDSGNKSVLKFAIKQNLNLKPVRQKLDPAKYFTVLWNEAFEYIDDKLKVSIPKESLYGNTQFTVRQSQHRDAHSPLFHVGDENVPLHSKISVGIKANESSIKLKDKLLMVKLNQNDKFSACGGRIDADGFLYCEVAEFGRYCLAIDTVPPTINLVGKSNNFTGKNKISLTIKDNLSGIDNYAGYIDGNWALFDYDAKNNLLTYIFDASKIKKGRTHKLKVSLTDNCKNSTTFTSDFKW